MSLRSAMRKAAGLIVEMPEEVPPHPEIASRDVPDMDDLDLDLPPEARLTRSSSAPNSPAPNSLPPNSPAPNSLAPGAAVRPVAKSVADIVRDSVGPNLDEIKVDEAQMGAGPNSGLGGIVSGDKIDFAAIYRAANLPGVPFGAEQMLETLASLPGELPLQTRRATVKAMLSTLGKTMGATPETVVADASRKLAALHSFEGFMEKKTAAALAKNEEEIAALEKQIDAKRTANQAAKTELAKITSGCESESDKLDEVLEFFSLDIGPSKHAPPASAPLAPPTVQPPAKTL